MSAAWVAAWAAVATAAIYIILGAIAFRQVAEARRLRLEQSRPFVVVDFAFRQFVIYIEVKNIGKTPARNVQISFDKPLETTLTRPSEIDESPALSKPIAMLAPGRSIQILFDVAHQRLNRADLPLAYEVTCAYQDMHGRRFNDPTATLDLGAYVGSALEPKGLPDLVAELERVRKEMDKWTDGTRGLLVQAVNRDARVRRQDRPHWRGHARQLRREQGWRAYGRWVVEHQLQRHGWL